MNETTFGELDKGDVFTAVSGDIYFIKIKKDTLIKQLGGYGLVNAVVLNGAGMGNCVRFNETLPVIK